MATQPTISMNEAFKASKNYDIRTLKNFVKQERTTLTQHYHPSEVAQELGILLNQQDESGATMLHWACYCGALDAVQLLCASGSSPASMEIGGKVPLHWAAYEGHYDVCKFMLDKLPAMGIKVDPVFEEQDGLTPCHLAVIGHHDEVARLFPNYDAVMARSRTSLDPIEILVDPNAHAHLSPSRSVPRAVSVDMGTNTEELRLAAEAAASAAAEHERRLQEMELERRRSEAADRQRRKDKRKKKREHEREQLMQALLLALAAQNTVPSQSMEGTRYEDENPEVDEGYCHEERPAIRWAPENLQQSQRESEYAQLESERQRQLEEIRTRSRASYFLRRDNSPSRPPWRPPASTYIAKPLRDNQRPPLK